MRLPGRSAIVTGGAGGIGHAIAARFAAAGAVVGVADLDGDGAAATVEDIRSAGGNAVPLKLDVTDRRSVDQAVATFLRTVGQVDVLVNNAALTARQDEPGDEEQAWDAMFATSLRGAYSCTRSVLPQMVERGSGVFVNISSINALLALGDDAYSAAKAGLISLTRTLAVRYGPRGIRANVICPGTIRTPAWQARERARPGLLTELAGLYPVRRIGEPGDVAAAALFLASDEASFISGAVLNVDGALTAGLPRFEEILENPPPRRA
jgi:meso-butanediol dehydrogenase / (S,S)-butanediol dehydrogenase / diacetyl reductase